MSLIKILLYNRDRKITLNEKCAIVRHEFSHLDKLITSLGSYSVKIIY